MSRLREIRRLVGARSTNDHGLYQKRKKPADCEVCGWTATPHKGLCFDHNHGTGEHRGWLCNGCNSALGHAGDNPEILVALAKYLQRTGYSATRQVPPQPTVASPPPEPPHNNDQDAPCQGARCN